MEILTPLRCIAALMLLFTPFDSFGQTAFVKIYSGNGYDRGEGSCQLSDSSYLVTGTSSSFADAPSQAFILHVDSMGNYLWSKAYGGTESETGKRIIAVEGFGYFVAGTSSSGGSGNFDNYLFFTDESGGQQWEVFTDNGGWEQVNDAALVASDTSIITVGQTDEGSDFVNDMYICRYSKTGELMWSVREGLPNGSDVANAVKMLTDTTFLVAGSSYVEDSLQNKAFLGLYHVDGSLIWKKTYGDNGHYWLNALVCDSSRIYGLGESLTELPGDDYDRYTLICDHSGTQLYVTDYKVQYSTRGTAFSRFKQGNDTKFFVSEQAINPNYPTFADGEDVFIQRFSENLEWDGYGVSYSGLEQDQVNQLIPTSDGFALATGFNTSYGGGGNCVLLVKIGSPSVFPVLSPDPEVTNLVSVKENGPIENLSVYPNPVAGKLTIKLENKPFTYAVSDLSGRQIMNGEGFGNVSPDFSEQASGTYLLMVRSEGRQTVLKIVR